MYRSQTSAASPSMHVRQPEYANKSSATVYGHNPTQLMRSANRGCTQLGSILGKNDIQVHFTLTWARQQARLKHQA
jgi:hypothetical protein